jgi:hypothetical protein
MANYSKYNAKDWSLQINTRYITGFDEDMFTWEKDEAYGEFSVGAQGDAMFNETNNDVHTLTVTLQPTSPSVDYMFELLNKRAEFSVLGINKKLRQRFGGEHARITEAPSIEAAAEGNPLEFVIQVADGYTESI